MNLLLCGAVAFVVCGCVAPPSESISVGSFDRNRFATTIQPILGERCANPSCHGQAARPLAIYAPRRFRLDSSRTHLDEPLTAPEIDYNFWASVLLSTEAERAEDALLVAKPLAIVRYHGGGAIFDSEDDSDYLRMVSWISEGHAQGVEP